MGLLDDINAERPPKVSSCGVFRIWQTLSDPDRKVLRDALTDPTISHATLTRALLKHMPDFPTKAVERHRRGECRCDPF